MKELLAAGSLAGTVVLDGMALATTATVATGIAASVAVAAE